jgi:hypothetical protein
MIDDNAMERALNYLGSTDEAAATAKSLSECLSEQRKTIKATLFLSADGKTNQVREMQAYAHADYKRHLDVMAEAVLDYEILKNKRLRAVATIDVWRSTNANRRKGNL